MTNDDERDYAEEEANAALVREESDDESAPDIWAMLEADAPDGCDAIQDLYSWSLNYDAGKGPFALFLDLIGWSAEELGEPIYSLKDASLGYIELAKLGEALGQYADKPHEVRDYTAALMAAESGS